jgi:aspartate/methionine/tyrosine aminotransferase
MINGIVYRLTPIRESALIGSKEGTACYDLNDGDTVLVLIRGFPPTQRRQTGWWKSTDYHLNEDNHWLPDFQELEALIPNEPTAGKQKALLFVNYPHVAGGAR